MRIGWGLKRYAAAVFLLVGFVTAAAAFPALQPDRPATYEASALVVARRLEIPQPQVPRLAQAVFSSGSVANRVATHLDLDTAPEALVPRHITVDPVPDSIALYVRGFADDPQKASQLADAGARALVAELNAIGPGVGQFGVQDRAQVEVASSGRRSMPLSIAIGVAAGTLFAVVLVAGLLAWKRPLLTPSEAENLVGLPVLATIRDAGDRGDGWSHSTPLGLRRLKKILPTQETGRVVFLGNGQTSHLCRALADLLADELPTVRAEALVHGSPVGSQESMSRSEHAVWAALQLPGGKDHTSVVIVVKRGARASDVEVLTTDWLPEELLGLVFIERWRTSRGLLRWRRTAQVRPAGSTSDTRREGASTSRA